MDVETVDTLPAISDFFRMELNSRFSTPEPGIITHNVSLQISLAIFRVKIANFGKVLRGQTQD